MNSQFLEICGPLQQGTFDQGTVNQGTVNQGTANQATGTLSLAQYKGPLDIAPLSLLLEGIHQCAVRLGRLVIPGIEPKKSLVLPASIKSFVQKQDIHCQDYQFNCKGEVFGQSARIAVTILDSQTDVIAAEAELTVSLIR
jgi:hypothetical protein